MSTEEKDHLIYPDVDINKSIYVSEDVVEFLKGLREQDVVDLKEIVELVHTIKVASHIVKWFIVSVLGTMVIISTFGTSVHTVWSFILTFFSGH